MTLDAADDDDNRDTEIVCGQQLWVRGNPAPDGNKYHTTESD